MKFSIVKTIAPTYSLYKVGDMPFKLSYFFLTPQRIQMPGEINYKARKESTA